MILLAVALGGAAGSCLRYAAGAFFLQHYPEFPWGTALVNIVGSFLIGVVFPYLASIDEHLRHLLVAGFLGGLTTMSGFSLETVQLAAGGRLLAAASNWAVGALVCLAACWCGIFITKSFS